ncbi:hypothetical protein P170DRAFT_435949 [Aspergillus steynii IBT 23096]|uniref:Uncharacterized protein n=1 Tax=Aspergillus steynii IBT 23096 TaxID=1392250 RepID=A0A2I2GD03_9EURO|nr:uncharacterized protein P170DRAFT_435949 [Aspergillus steynii IBT 23096]PLB50776.1 hypothetical protein P170DRAFT_435949 [Aspergillus steynii IBT 23096]
MNLNINPAPSSDPDPTITPQPPSHPLSYLSRIPSDPIQPEPTNPSLRTPPAAEKTTTYHIYPTHQNPSHALITTIRLPKSSSARRKHLKRNPSALTTDDTSTPTPSSYFLHLPAIAFHSPPRTLRRGATKTSPPLCIIHNSTFWRRWRILSGSALMATIDPRGVVSWERRSTWGNGPVGDAEVKGYKLRKWRLWGESGKAYHRRVNADRDRNRGAKARTETPVPVQGQNVKASEKKAAQTEMGIEILDESTKTWDPVHASDVLPVPWTNPSPFSSRVRWYGFTYNGVHATWKGSRDVPAKKKWGRRLMPVHHLKLVAECPSPGISHFDTKGSMGELQGGEEVVLARYSSSLSHGKHGTLVIFDEEVSRVFGSQGVGSRKEKGFAREGDEVGEMDEYDVIVATAMCMVLGEWQKRKTVLEILLALAGGGAEGAGY